MQSDDEVTTGAHGTSVDERAREAGAVEAGLDALETRTAVRAPWPRRVLRTAGPPLLAAGLFLLAWQIVFWAELKHDYVIPSPGMVWDEFVT